MTDRQPKSSRRFVGPMVVLIVAVAGVGAVIWGALVADPGIKVFLFDAGPVTELAVGEVKPLAQVDVYVVGLEDGRIRAVDGVVQSTGCAVRFLPDDERALSRNPLRLPGVFVDPCGDGVWAITGDAVAGEEPLRTFHLSYERDENGVQHVQVEVIGRSDPQAVEGD